MNFLSKIKLALVVLAFSLVFTSINAQVKVGLSAAYSITNTGKQETASKISRRQFSDKIQYLGQDNAASIGIALYSSFEKLFLRIDAQYTSIKSTYALTSTIGSEGAPIENTMVLTDKNDFMSFPITAGLQLGKTQFGLGPVFNFRINSDNMISSNSNLMYTDRSMSTGFHFFTAYKLSDNFHINANFEKSLTNLGDQFNYENKSEVNLNTRPSTISLGIAYFL